MTEQRRTLDGTASAGSGSTVIGRASAQAERARLRYLALAQRQPLYGLPLSCLATYAARQGMLLSSAVAFRLFFWLLPVALVAAAVVAGLNSVNLGVAQRVTDTAGVTGVARDQMITALTSGERSWSLAALLGVFALLWATMLLRRSLILVNAHVWQARVVKTGYRQLLAAVLTFVGFVALMAFCARVVGLLDELLPGGVLIVVLAQAAVTSAGWILVIQQLPDRRKAWSDLLPGAVLFGVGLAVLHAVSRFYLPARVEHSTELYGSLGVAAVILVWLLFIGQLVVWSALVNVVWFDYRLGRELGEQGVESGVDAAVESGDDGAETREPQARER
ncbi:MAG: YihY/virulence factor BrkB family protein [Humibacillus sp.]|nr:YihY/virulence factor BrkB family protein [Humibacillus sp.]MDN5775673.1 YihY/virulence factor BrkB family protein [Humibacillus sp.]